MSRLRVLFCAAAYPSRAQPLQSVFVREHARAAALFDDVRVLHGPFRVDGRLWQLREVEDAALTAGIPTQELCWGRSPIPKTHALIYLSSALFARAALGRQGYAPHIVHAHYSRALPAALLARSFGVPLLITAHSSHFPRGLVRGRELWEARWAYAFAARVLPVSEVLHQALKACGLRANYEVVPNAVDTDRFRFSGEAPRKGRRQARLIWVGSLVPVKAIDCLLVALKRLQSLRQDWCCELVGGGGFLEAHRRQVERLGLVDHVRFSGPLPKHEVADRMREADFLVLPSLWENNPCVLLEAMACGLPVVASDVGGIPELVDASRGILCRPRDAGALAGGLAEMLDRQMDFDRPAIAAVASERYSHHAVGSRLHRIYQTLVHRDDS